jgi:hypothetical protein
LHVKAKPFGRALWRAALTRSPLCYCAGRKAAEKENPLIARLDRARAHGKNRD